MRVRNHRRRVAVIGGGVSGLAAAHHLRKLDPTVEVRLFESADRLGGVIQTTRKNGFLLEAAADNFLTSCSDAVERNTEERNAVGSAGGASAAIELCRDLGLENELIETRHDRQGAMVLSHGQLEPIPSAFTSAAQLPIWPMIATKIFSPLGKLRGGCGRFVLPKNSIADESIQSFVTRRFGVEVYQRLVQPMVNGIDPSNPMQLSVASPIPRFLERGHRNASNIRRLIMGRSLVTGRSKNRQAETSNACTPFASLRGGMSRLIDSLGESLPEDAVRLNARVENVTRVDRKWHIDYRDMSHSPGGVESWQADGIVVATPATHAAKILQPLDEKLARRLGRIEYSACAVVTLAFRRDQIHRKVDSFGFVVPHVENSFLLSCSFSSEKYEGRAPGDTVLMRMFIGELCNRVCCVFPITN